MIGDWGANGDNKAQVAVASGMSSFVPGNKITGRTDPTGNEIFTAPSRVA